MVPRWMNFIRIYTFFGTCLCLSLNARGQETLSVPSTEIQQSLEKHFDQLQPILQEYCLHCHNVDVAKSGIRLDTLTSKFNDRELFLWKDILKQVEQGAMPPKEETELPDEKRNDFSSALRSCLRLIQSRPVEQNGSIRRLTVSQYQNTLRDLLLLQENVSDLLPPDGVSKEGFTNDGQVLGLSPLQMEYYWEIAEKAIDLSLVDPSMVPTIQNFRVELGQDINPSPCPDKLILGADSALLRNQDFVVIERTPEKPFPFHPFRMRTEYDFIEGYQGNDTVRDWRHYNSIYHSVFACMRGSHGYPKGEAYQAIPQGLLLRPAIPSSEIFGESSTYGPKANFKISLRELPEHGNFRVKVQAARYDDGLLLEPTTTGPTAQESLAQTDVSFSDEHRGTLTIASSGIYFFEIDYALRPGMTIELPAENSIAPVDNDATQAFFRPQIGGRFFSMLLHPKDSVAVSSTGNEFDNSHIYRSPWLLARFDAGNHPIEFRAGNKLQVLRVNARQVSNESRLGQRFLAFEKRSPWLGVHLGLRRDCGSTMQPVGEPVEVPNRELQEFIFEGAVNDFPSPFVEKDNVNYLAGIREIGVRSEYTDGRDLPRLLIRSIEFEGPYYPDWPPPSHRAIYIDSNDRENKHVYARQILSRFLERAYRRPASEIEIDRIVAIWKSSYEDAQDFDRSLRDAMLVVLTSPQFLFLIENSATPGPERLDDFELASKLSYFLWNSPPDALLLEMARQGSLYSNLDQQVIRMMEDRRFDRAMHEFVSQWLSLDRFDVVEIDTKRFPELTRNVRTELRKEPIEFVEHLLRRNLPIRHLIDSDFSMVNDTVASYYGLGQSSEVGYRFAPVQHKSRDLGGLITQASILAGLSNGRESNPVKRGAWFARKIIAEPPDDPPPNVPELRDIEGRQLSLREKLELHRDQDGCKKCHAGIDPWGIPFEPYDASGRFQKAAVDGRAVLPDGCEVEDVQSLKRYLIDQRLERVAFSFMKHLAGYATGRSLTFHEVEELEAAMSKWKTRDFPSQEMLRELIQSDLFLMK